MGAMLNLNKNWIDLASMLQYSNDQIIIFFGNDLLQIHKLRLFSRIKLFEVGNLPKVSFFGEHDTIYKTCLKTRNQHNFSQRSN